MHQHGGDIYQYENIVDFSSNVNLLGIPESVKDAAKAAIDASWHYPDIYCRKLRTAVAGKDRVKESHIFFGNGAADVIFSLCQAKKPRRALLPVPSFFEYEQALRSVGCGVTYFYLREDTGFAVTGDLLDAVTPKIDILFLCNPNNPTGEVIDPELLRALLRRCSQTGTMLVLDECFLDFLEDKKEATLCSEIASNRNLFILKAFTKMYAIPGLRLGYGLCSDERLLQTMEQMGQPWRVSVPAQEAGLAALQEMGFEDQTRKEVAVQKAVLLDGLTETGCKVYGSKANYIFFKSVPGLQKALQDKGFLIRDCSNYKGLREGYYRIAVRTAEENEAFLEALRRIILHNS